MERVTIQTIATFIDKFPLGWIIWFVIVPHSPLMKHDQDGMKRRCFWTQQKRSLGMSKARQKDGPKLRYPSQSNSRDYNLFPSSIDKNRHDFTSDSSAFTRPGQRKTCQQGEVREVLTLWLSDGWWDLDVQPLLSRRRHCSFVSLALSETAVGHQRLTAWAASPTAEM